MTGLYIVYYTHFFISGDVIAVGAVAILLLSILDVTCRLSKPHATSVPPQKGKDDLL